MIPSTAQVSCGVHTCRPNRTEGSETPGHPQLCIKIEASLDYVRFCPEKHKQKCGEGVGKKPLSHPGLLIFPYNAFVWVWSSFSWHSLPSAAKKKKLLRNHFLLDNISYLTVGHPYPYFIHENLTFRKQCNFLELIDSLGILQNTHPRPR